MLKLNYDLGPYWVAVVALIVVSLGVHEAAHAWVAWLRGDSTGKDMGRMTINPIPHIDPLMTIVLPVLLVAIGSPYLFGGAKPVPVNGHQLKHPLFDMMLVALAGPASNFLQAIFFALLMKTLVVTGVYSEDSYVVAILAWAVFFNLILTVFNLLPIPPLDGSRVMTWILPRGIREVYAGLERFGLLIVVALLLSGVLRPLIEDGLYLMYDAVVWIVELGGLW